MIIDSVKAEKAAVINTAEQMCAAARTAPKTRGIDHIVTKILTEEDIIKLSDKLHNMRTLNFMAVNKQKKIARETLDIFSPLANRLGVGKIKAELEDLETRKAAAAALQAGTVEPTKIIEERKEESKMVQVEMRDSLEILALIKPELIYEKMDQFEILKIYDIIIMS